MLYFGDENFQSLNLLPGQLASEREKHAASSRCFSFHDTLYGREKRRKRPKSGLTRNTQNIHGWDFFSQVFFQHINRFSLFFSVFHSAETSVEGPFSKIYSSAESHKFKIVGVNLFEKLLRRGIIRKCFGPETLFLKIRKVGSAFAYFRPL